MFSDVGTWVQLIVVGSLVARETGSALYTGLTALALFTPQGLCAPIGGLLADRYDRRSVFVGALCLQTVATAVLAVVLAAGVRQPLLLSAIIVFSSAGNLIRMGVEEISEQGRDATGVRVARVAEGDTVVAVARVLEGEHGDAEAGEES